MAALVFLALGLSTFGIFAESSAIETAASGKVLLLGPPHSQIYDPNGVITCSDMDREFFPPSDVYDGSLTFVPLTGEILLCGGSKYYTTEYGYQCLVVNNGDFVPHSHLTQQHKDKPHTAVINGTVWLFGGVEFHGVEVPHEGYVIESLAGEKWSIQDAPRTPWEHNFDACSVFTGEALVLIGGYTKNVSKLIPGSSQWESLSPLPAHRENHGCVYLQPNDRFPNGSILVAGGTYGKNCKKCFSDSVLYDISLDSWIPAGEIGASHAQGSLVDVDGRIIFAGGHAVCSGALTSLKYAKACSNIHRTSRVDEFHLENLGTDKPTWTKMKSSLNSVTSASGAVIPIQHWNDGKSCKIPDPLPTQPPPPAITQGINDEVCLSSPNYPSNYPNNMRLKKTFSVPAGEDIEITIMDMDVEGSTDMCKDFLRFYDGKGNVVKHHAYTSMSNQFLRKRTDICERRNVDVERGSTQIGKFVIPTSSASVYFHSDGTQTTSKRGFKFCYKPARRWRDDGRCGNNIFKHFKNAYGTIGECDPISRENGKGPCCSSHGFCGPFSVHCDCKFCVNYKISFCPEMTFGDNEGDVYGGKEIFLQENQLIESTCQANCQKLYPDSVGITESTTQKYTNGQPKCWCEFGQPKLNQDQFSKNYQTCVFKP